MIYCQFDSYFSGLGSEVLIELRKMMKEEKFNEWLELLKKLLSEDLSTRNTIRSKLHAHEDDQNSSGVSRGPLESLFYDELMSSDDLDGIDDVSLSLSFSIEYIYVLDFDAKTFIIHYRDEKGGEKIEEFDLNHLPSSLEDNGEHIYDEEAPILK